MKLIIAGSRHLNRNDIWGAIEFFTIKEAIDEGQIEEVICGGARGVDQIGKLWAEDQGITVTMFPAQWVLFGKKAGHLRNREMAKYADRLLLIWDGISKGSANMKAEMIKLDKPIYEIIIENPNY